MSRSLSFFPVAVEIGWRSSSSSLWKPKFRNTQPSLSCAFKGLYFRMPQAKLELYLYDGGLSNSRYHYFKEVCDAELHIGASRLSL